MHRTERNALKYCIEVKNICVPVLSIGQCIELLDSLTEERNGENTRIRFNIDRYSMWIGNTRLIDQLWQAVKEIL